MPPKCEWLWTKIQNQKNQQNQLVIVLFRLRLELIGIEDNFAEQRSRLPAALRVVKFVSCD